MLFGVVSSQYKFRYEYIRMQYAFVASEEAIGMKKDHAGRI